MFCIGGCNCKEDTAKQLPQKVIKDLPKNEENEKFGLYKLTRKRTLEAGLPLIDDGFDSLFIRVWQTSDTTIFAIDVKFEKNHWSSALHKIEMSIVDNEIVYGNLRSVFAGPKSGWPNFSKKLINSGILDLPSDIKLKDYHNTTASDASFVTIEVATKNRYRIYSYSQPGMHLQYPEAKKMTLILDYLSNEFNFEISEKFVESSM